MSRTFAKWARGWAAVVFVGLLASSATAAGLAETIDKLLLEPKLQSATVGIVVADADSGRVLYAREARRLFILASNTKLFATAAALDELGPHHRLETVVYRHGQLNGSVLDGDLVVVGGGDPSLGSRFDKEPDASIRRLARSVAEAGVKEVRGALLLDDRLFDRQFQHPGWPADQLDRWYCAPIGALTLNDGCVDVVVRPANALGKPSVVSLAPVCDLIAVDNRCATVKRTARHLVSVFRSGTTNRLAIRGSMRVGSGAASVSIAVAEPTLVFGSVFKRHLAEAGVKIEGGTRAVGEDWRPTAGAPWVVAAYHATLLGPLLPVVNKRSQNQWADTLCKLVAARHGEPGSFAGGVKRMTALALGLGLEAEEVVLADGSGMSRSNLASPSAVTALLRGMRKHPHGQLFSDSLAIGGVDGTLRRRLQKVDGSERVRAKTGTLQGVSSVSGFILPKMGEETTLVFSILCNDLKIGASQARALQDGILAAIVRTPAAHYKGGQ